MCLDSEQAALALAVHLATTYKWRPNVKISSSPDSFPLTTEVDASSQAHVRLLFSLSHFSPLTANTSSLSILSLAKIPNAFGYAGKYGGAVLGLSVSTRFVSSKQGNVGKLTSLFALNISQSNLDLILTNSLGLRDSRGQCS
jgi:hypothetical protein